MVLCSPKLVACFLREKSGHCLNILGGVLTLITSNMSGESMKLFEILKAHIKSDTNLRQGWVNRVSSEGGHIRDRSLRSALLIYKRRNAEIYVESVPEHIP